MNELKDFKLVHVGFGKTGTKTLQNLVFPEICKEFNLEFIDLNSLKKNKEMKVLKGATEGAYDPFYKNKYHPLQNINTVNLPRRYLISSEDLIGIKWRPQSYKKAFEINKKIFDENCNILITIRKPSDLLNGIYIQNIQNFDIIREEDFFITYNKQI